MEDKPPFLKSWPQVYAVVLALLAVEIILGIIITNHFN